jgi:hypothetical protein
MGGRTRTGPGRILLLVVIAAVMRPHSLSVRPGCGPRRGPPSRRLPRGRDLETCARARFPASRLVPIFRAFGSKRDAGSTHGHIRTFHRSHASRRAGPSGGGMALGQPRTTTAGTAVSRLRPPPLGRKGSSMSTAVGLVGAGHPASREAALSTSAGSAPVSPKEEVAASLRHKSGPWRRTRRVTPLRPPGIVPGRRAR